MTINLKIQIITQVKEAKAFAMVVVWMITINHQAVMIKTKIKAIQTIVINSWKLKQMLHKQEDLEEQRRLLKGLGALLVSSGPDYDNPTLGQAMEPKDWSKWQKDIEKELKSL